jgi:hypothetical protein
MTAEELITQIATCVTCGKEHAQRLRVPDYPLAGQTWESPDDGHPYRPRLHRPTIAQLREIAGAS